MQTKSELVHKSKLVLNSGLVREIVIWRVPTCDDYPEGIKYRFLLVDPTWKKIMVLFDNQCKSKEHTYNFVSLESLIIHFHDLCNLKEKQYENNEN